MDVIREIQALLYTSTQIMIKEKLRFMKISTTNRSNDDYHFFLDEISDDALDLLEKADFVDDVSKKCQGKYCVKLNRPHIFKDTISRIYKEASRYGEVTDNKINRKALINVFGDLEPENQSFDVLRSLYLASLLAKLLLANSYDVSMAPKGNVEDLEDHIEQILTDSSEKSSLIEDKNLATHNVECVERFKASDWMEDVKNKLKNNEDLFEIVEENGDKIKINLKKFIEDENMSDRFSANVNILMLTSHDKSIEPLHNLEKAINRWGEEPKVSCIHVVHNKNYLQQQKIEVFWRMMNVHVHRTVKQYHLIYSRASTDNVNNQELNPAKLLRTRKNQIASAFRSKYGAKKAAFFTDVMMEKMAKASLRFEFLSIKPTLETKISAGDNCFEDRSGVFVFYNYARISTMLDKYYKLVEEGHYPPLIDVEEIDFKCLRLEEEWRLLFNFIIEYPCVVKDSISKDADGFVTGATTQKICQYLTSLSNSFSKYYSKTHILTDPLPHLMMTMQARLHLIRSIKQVMDNALTLLSIQPLHRL